LKIYILIIEPIFRKKYLNTTTASIRALYFLVEPMTGFEPVTSSLPRKYSTPELHWRFKRRVLSLIKKHKDNYQTRNVSGRRDSNPRPSAWKADALPTELLPHLSCLFSQQEFPFCGESRIRTYEVERQQIYSLPQLAALVSPLSFWNNIVSQWRDSNPRPADYKSAALAN
jgi:hypothetical protein